MKCNAIIVTLGLSGFPKAMRFTVEEMSCLGSDSKSPGNRLLVTYKDY